MLPEDGHERTGSAARISGFESHANSTAGGLMTQLKLLSTFLWLIMQNLLFLLHMGLWTLPTTALFACNCEKLERLNGSTSINAWDESERMDIKASDVLVFTLLLDLEAWALVETVDLVIDDSQQQLVEFTQFVLVFSNFEQSRFSSSIRR